MKKILLTALAFSCVLSVFAQKIKVNEADEKIGNGTNNALVVSIYGASIKDIEHEWKSMMKDYGAKVSTKDGVFADNAVIKQMGNNTVDIYEKSEDKKNGEVKFMVAFDLGGAYLSSSAQSDKYKIAEKIVHDFAVKMTREAIEEQLKQQQKALNKLNDQQKDLVHDNDKMNKDIKNYQDKIKNDQDALVKNKADQEKKQQEINGQQKVVDDVNKKAKAVE
ncbi:MAG: hypothetical protein ABI199_09160 [Bacteroidia bacterium]